MKVIYVLVLLVAAVAASAVPNHFENPQSIEYYAKIAKSSPEGRNWLINTLIRQVINLIRDIIANGNNLFGIPPLDPLKIDNLDLDIPAGLINLKLNLRDAILSGIGGFEADTVNFDTSEISFDIEISVPHLNISAGHYKLDGDILTAIPIYGDGNAVFSIRDFRFRAKLYLKQSDNLKSAILDRIDNLTYDIPYFKSDLTGAIGGGDIDKIVNSVIEEVVVGYVIRFRGAITNIIATAGVAILNPILEQLDTWQWLEMILPN